MRRITFSILLLFSTQAFGMFRLLPRSGARFTSQALRSNLRPTQLPKRPLEAFALHTRGFATEKNNTNEENKKRLTKSLKNKLENYNTSFYNFSNALVPLTILGGSISPALIVCGISDITVFNNLIEGASSIITGSAGMSSYLWWLRKNYTSLNKKENQIQDTLETIEKNLY